ncbi:unnamed protein product [Amoebophrya sp. A25]|nr:unnamed protein product [Amoebophrya sp. A25]|eukprot:GSA25T00025851001.1
MMTYDLYLEKIRIDDEESSSSIVERTGSSIRTLYAGPWCGSRLLNNYSYKLKVALARTYKTDVFLSDFVAITYVSTLS